MMDTFTQWMMLQLSPLYGSNDPDRIDSYVSFKFKILCNSKEEVSGSHFDYMMSGGAMKYNNFNRYSGHFPYDHSRVRLQRLPDHDYINASWLRHPDDISRCQGNDPLSGRTYIATQAPLPNTFAHFWLMVFEQRVSSIVCLAPRCDQYWPDAAMPLLDMLGGRLQVEFISSDVHDADDAAIVQRTFKVRGIATGSEEEQEQEEELFVVRHIHYRTWPDFGVPESDECLRTVLRLVNPCCLLDSSVPAVEATPAGLDKLLVHCSAGIGRTGTFCVIDAMVRSMHHSISPGRCISTTRDTAAATATDGTIDDISIDPVLSSILAFRSQRRGMVETVGQLGYIYRYLHNYHKDFIRPCLTLTA